MAQVFVELLAFRGCSRQQTIDIIQQHFGYDKHPQMQAMLMAYVSPTQFGTERSQGRPVSSPLELARMIERVDIALTSFSMMMVLIARTRREEFESEYLILVGP